MAATAAPFSIDGECARQTNKWSSDKMKIAAAASAAKLDFILTLGHAVHKLKQTHVPNRLSSNIVSAPCISAPPCEAQVVLTGSAHWGTDDRCRRPESSPSTTSGCAPGLPCGEVKSDSWTFIFLNSGTSMIHPFLATSLVH